MELSRIHQLFNDLKTNRSRFGLWCCDLEKLGHEQNIAVQLGAESLDVTMLLRSKLENDSDMVVLDEHKLIDMVSEIAKKQGKQKVLIYNLDVLLAKLNPAQCRDFWDLLFSGLIYQPRSLVFMIPLTATNLYPSGENLNKWQRNKRIILED